MGNSSVSVVLIGTLLGVFKVTFGSCALTRGQFASAQKHVMEAAESKKAVFLLGHGGGMQTG